MIRDEIRALAERCLDSADAADECGDRAGADLYTQVGWHLELQAKALDSFHDGRCHHTHDGVCPFTPVCDRPCPHLANEVVSRNESDPGAAPTARGLASTSHEGASNGEA